MRVLLTGGAGYIGSHLAVELLAGGHEVLLLDNFANSSPAVVSRIAELAGRAPDLCRADLRDRAATGAAMAGFRPEAVIHLAGLKAVGEGERDPVAYHDVNVGGTIALLAEAERVDCRRVIFSSSATVYGTPRYLPFDEEHPCAPANVYGRTKWIAELVISDWQRAGDARSAVHLRYFNPVGAHPSGRIGEHPNATPNNLMPYVAQVAVGVRPRVQVFGDDYDTPDGTGVRDYIHVVDLARAHVAALARPPGRCEVFNIGTGRGHSVLEMIRAFAEASGREIPVEIVERRPGDIARSVADPARAIADLGWRAEFGLAEMCASAWAWQSANPDGYGPQ